MTDDHAALIERLHKRAEQDSSYAENNQIVADLLQPQVVKFEQRYENSGSHNTYAVRMAIDHRNSARRDTQWAADLTEAAAAIKSLIAQNRAKDAALRDQTDIVDRLCSAIERQEQDIGGESVRTVLRLLGPTNDRARKAL